MGYTIKDEESNRGANAPTVGHPSFDDSTVARLSHIWQELLRLETVSPDQTFFDLGGDSSLGVQMFSRIEETFGVKLPLATLYDAPTIEELSRMLQGEVSAPAWSPLVPIQTAGSRPLFFCMHPHGGNVLVYRQLSRYLGLDQPFYGLQSQGLDGSCPPLARIEDMAAIYVTEIRKIQPHGPYFLGGYCMGGTVAFEVAQLLQDEGEPIALLALFDTIEWSQLQLPSFLEKSYYNGERLRFHVADFLSLNSADRRKFLREKLQTLKVRIPVWASMLLRTLRKDSRPSSEAKVLGEIWRANFNACANYIPRPYSGVITEFRPMRQYRMYDKPSLKWKRVAQGGLEIVVLPVNPPAMLADPYVRHLALALRRSIDAARSRCVSISASEMATKTL